MGERVGEDVGEWDVDGERRLGWHLGCEGCDAAGMYYVLYAQKFAVSMQATCIEVHPDGLGRGLAKMGDDEGFCGDRGERNESQRTK